MTGLQVRPVKRVRDAQGGACQDCPAVFNVGTCPYWSWTKSVWMHRQSGHRVGLYTVEAVR
jgi:hypothetical protein